MCAHSTSGAEITEKIATTLYPKISKAFQEVLHHAALMKIEERNFDVPVVFFELKTEFESLKNYETKLVFPSVLKVFNTKDDIENRPTINIAELQKLTKNKEAHILDLVAILNENIKTLETYNQQQLKALVLLFETNFVAYKEEWKIMLNGWNTSCACFLAANKSEPLLKH